MGFLQTLGQAFGTAAKANPVGMALAGGNALLNLGLGIADRIKANKLQQQWNTLNAQRPDYEIPQGFQSALDVYKREAANKRPAWLGMSEEALQQSSARARTAAERGSISSTSYAEQTDIINARETEAIQDMYLKVAEQESAKQYQLAQGYQMLGGQQEKAQDWNVIGKWTTGMNVLESKMGAATQNANTRLSNVIPGLANFAGTSYYKSMLEQLGGRT